MSDPCYAAGLTVRDLTRRYRVGADKVRGWIARGEIRAVNTSTALCGKPRWVVSPDALVEFERRRASDPPQPQPKKRNKQTGFVDYFPD
jgi:transposase